MSSKTAAEIVEFKEPELIDEKSTGLNKKE